MPSGQLPQMLFVKTSSMPATLPVRVSPTMPTLSRQACFDAQNCIQMQLALVSSIHALERVLPTFALQGYFTDAPSPTAVQACLEALVQMLPSPCYLQKQLHLISYPSLTFACAYPCKQIHPGQWAYLRATRAKVGL